MNIFDFFKKPVAGNNPMMEDPRTAVYRNLSAKQGVGNIMGAANMNPNQPVGNETQSQWDWKGKIIPAAMMIYAMKNPRVGAPMLGGYFNAQQQQAQQKKEDDWRQWQMDIENKRLQNEEDQSAYERSQKEAEMVEVTPELLQQMGIDEKSPYRTVLQPGTKVPRSWLYNMSSSIDEKNRQNNQYTNEKSMLEQRIGSLPDGPVKEQFKQDLAFASIPGNEGKLADIYGNLDKYQSDLAANDANTKKYQETATNLRNFISNLPVDVISDNDRGFLLISAEDAIKKGDAESFYDSVRKEYGMPKSRKEKLQEEEIVSVINKNNRTGGKGGGSGEEGGKVSQQDKLFLSNMKDEYKTWHQTIKDKYGEDDDRYSWSMDKYMRERKPSLYAKWYRLTYGQDPPSSAKGGSNNGSSGQGKPGKVNVVQRNKDINDIYQAMRSRDYKKAESLRQRYNQTYGTNYDLNWWANYFDNHPRKNG